MTMFANGKWRRWLVSLNYLLYKGQLSISWGNERNTLVICIQLIQYKANSLTTYYQSKYLLSAVPLMCVCVCECANIREREYVCVLCTPSTSKTKMPTSFFPSFLCVGFWFCFYKHSKFLFFLSLFLLLFVRVLCIVYVC